MFTFYFIEFDKLIQHIRYIHCTQKWKQA